MATSEYFQKLIEEFWNSPTTLQEDRDALIRFLRARPNREEAKPYVTDIDRRLSLISELQGVCQVHEIHHTYFNSQLWAFLLVIPLYRLQNLLGTVKQWDHFYPTACVKQLSSSLSAVFKTFLIKQISDTEVASQYGFSNRPGTQIKRDRKKAQEVSLALFYPI